MPGFTFFTPIPRLADTVETIWDVDLPETEIAQALSFKVLPAASPTICVHYRAPAGSDQRINPGNCRQRMTGVQTGTITIRPTGPVGAIIIHLKPEAAWALTRYDMGAFTDANVGLRDLFGPVATARLENMLGEAKDEFERASVIQHFLLGRIQQHASDALVRHAVLKIMRDPNCSVHTLAERLDISERHLSRRFHAMVGTNVKRFARLVRFGKAVAARRRGASWAHITYSCGYTDQAHLVREFKLITGSPPEGLLKTISAAKYSELNSALALSGFSNTFVA